MGSSLSAVIMLLLCHSLVRLSRCAAMRDSETFINVTRKA